MNKLKVGDIVLAIADNSEFVNREKGKLCEVIKIYSNNKQFSPTMDIKPLWGRRDIRCYYIYKFKKPTKKESKESKFKYIVDKLKGVL